MGDYMAQVCRPMQVHFLNLILLFLLVINYLYQACFRLFRNIFAHLIIISSNSGIKIKRIFRFSGMYLEGLSRSICL